MPGFNGTGPTGAGPMTGGGRGVCATDAPGFIARFVRRGMGIGRGQGLGLGRAARGLGRSAGRGHRNGWVR